MVLGIKNPPASARGKRHESDPWVGKIPGEGMATHSSILAWRNPLTEEPGGLQSVGSQRAETQLSNLAHTLSPVQGDTSLCPVLSQTESFCCPCCHLPPLHLPCRLVLPGKEGRGWVLTNPLPLSGVEPPLRAATSIYHQRAAERPGGRQAPHLKAPPGWPGSCGTEGVTLSCCLLVGWRCTISQELHGCWFISLYPLDCFTHGLPWCLRW